MAVDLFLVLLLAIDLLLVLLLAVDLLLVHLMVVLVDAGRHNPQDVFGLKKVFNAFTMEE